MSNPRYPMKRIVICCDGTWLDANAGTEISLNPFDWFNSLFHGRVTLQTPSNVTRLGRSLKQVDTTNRCPIQQIMYYQSGVGTQNLVDRILGGATGYGLADHIGDAYQFIAANYNHQTYDADQDGIVGDEVYLVGFSRGAFTARSIAAFINDIGLLTKVGMMHFYTIFEDWENHTKKNWEAPFYDDPFPGHGLPEYNMSHEGGRRKYVDELIKRNMTVPGVKIKAVAVWDTVGSLGLPRLAIFNALQRDSMDFAFVDTCVPPCVQNAIHAIALDENREPFKPTIWELPNPKQGQNLTQVWFAGCHSDVGGSYVDTRAADITLAWMVSQLSRLGLAFDLDAMKRQLSSSQNESLALPWGCGPIHNEYKNMYRLYASQTRSPMSYMRHDHYTGLPKVPQEPLVGTNERVHSSVRIRWGLNGRNYQGKEYRSPALKEWKVYGAENGNESRAWATNEEASTLQNATAQHIRDSQVDIAWTNGRSTMPEELISDLEWELIGNFTPDISKQFLGIVP